MDLIADKETTKQFVLMDELDYGVDSRDFIRQALAGYAGGSAIASELLQNADDARADSISFHFRRDALVVRNSSSFSERDFANILNIASGGKREETETIGTWGTGFLSVFHITDRPILESAGYRIEFDPSKRRLPRYGAEVMNGTVFTFPWRREVTDLSKHLEARVWNDDEIDALKQDLVVAIYRLNLFLRHVKSISIFQDDPDEKILASVQRIRRTAEAKPFYTRETWEVQYQRAGVQSRSDTWVYYQGVVPSHPAIQDTAIKDRAVALAFPLESRGWLIENVPGSLYNFLPTPIQTGFGFQLNGAFFPNNNRNSIILDEHTHPQKSRWNNAVLRTMGDLLVTALLDMRDLVSQPRRFYELPPVEEPRYDFLKPIHDAFASAAPDLPIVFSSLNRWDCPRKVFVGLPGSRLPGLAADYMDLLPTGVPQAFRNFLANISPTLTWRHVLEFLESNLETGLALSDAHPMIAGRDKLYQLYNELPSSLLPEEKARLGSLPLCLTDDGVLSSFDEVWRAAPGVRDLLRLADMPFVDLETQQGFPQLLEQLVSQLRGRELVSWLSDNLWLEPPVGLSSLDFLAEDFDHLEKLIEFIGEDLSNVDLHGLAQLPLVRTQKDLLVSANRDVFFSGATDKVEQSMLVELGLNFVHTQWARNESVRRVIARVGVRDIQPRDAIAALRDKLDDWLRLSTEELIDKLIGLYSFFCRHERQLSDIDREDLCRLSICVTQEGRPVSTATTLVHLPPQDGVRQYEILAVLDNLKLDHLLHSKLVRGGETFLSKILGIQALESAQLIRDIIVPHYHDPRLDSDARHQLLHYISDQMRAMLRNQRQELLPILQRTHLIRCADDIFRSANQVYFASPALDAVFMGGYHQLHPDYGVLVAQPGDMDQEPFRHSTWYWLFRELGVNEQPAPVDMFNAVKLTVEQTTPDDKGAVDRIRSIYHYLNGALGENKELASDASLRRLAQLPWLPSRHDSSRWYLPRDLYQASMVSFVGDQAPLLAFAESATTLRELLQMPGFPPVSLVVRNLLSLAGKNLPVKDFSVYADIGRRWTDLDQHDQEALRKSQVVWDPLTERYWLPSHVFLADYRRNFGHRRAYLKPPGGDAQTFLERVGVKSQPVVWADFLDLLNEITRDFQNSQEVGEDDRWLLIACFDHLGRQENSDERSLSLKRLDGIPCVPGKDGRLHPPSRVVFADRPDVLEQFDPSAVPVVDETGMTEAAYAFLRRSLQVASLSRLVQRSIVEIRDQIEDFGHERRLRQLSNPFKRILFTRQDRNEDAESGTGAVDQLKGVRVFTCSHLMVQYSLGGPDDWTISGHRTEEDALYDLDHNHFFFKRSTNEFGSLLAVARELERVYFPNNKESVLIERLLEFLPAEIDPFLDSHGYRRLYHDEFASVQPQESLLAEWGNVTTIPWEQDHAVDGQTEASTVDSESEGDNLFVDKPGVGIDEGFQDEEIDLPSEGSIDDDYRSAIEDPSVQETWPFPISESRDIPPFQGIRRPAVPVLPNDYQELERRFGLKPPEGLVITTTLASDDAVADDGQWTAGKDIESDMGVDERPVTLVRFTLTFVNRYEGFFPLHRRARRMLYDRPSLLHCHTDFEDQAFDLYVDYDQGVIYNETVLTEFFEANAIPAGGIVYLERVHAVTCRLFWKPSDASITHVRCLELLEDGTLSEYEIPAIDVPCEVAEYVLRAEKRLEDPEALFLQAMDQRGIFQTICEVFGERDRELTYKDIFDGVIARRQVAEASIRTQLQVRPCFVSIGNDRWRFEPDRGIEPRREMPISEGVQLSRKPGSTADAAGAILPGQRSTRPHRSPYAGLLDEIRQQFILWNRSLESNTQSPTQQLQQLSNSLASFAKVIADRLHVLRQEHPVADEALVDLWEALETNPVDPETRRAFDGYILQQLCHDPRSDVLLQIRLRLAETSKSNRDHILYPQILGIARNAESQDMELALDIYALLNQEGAGDFTAQIVRLNERKEIHSWLTDLQNEEFPDKRWIALNDLWEIYPGSAEVRRTIQSELKHTAASIDRRLTGQSATDRIDGLTREFLEWRDRIMPLANSWETDVECISALTNLTARMFSVQIARTEMDRTAYRAALHVANSLKVEDLSLLPIDSYLEAVGAVADQLHDQDDTFAATILLDYALFLFRNYYAGSDKYVAAKISERAGRLYDYLNWFGRAYERLHFAQRYSTTAKKIDLGHDLFELSSKRDLVSEVAITNAWLARAKQLSDSPQFVALVNADLYLEFIHSY